MSKGIIWILISIGFFLLLAGLTFKKTPILVIGFLMIAGGLYLGLGPQGILRKDQVLDTWATLIGKGQGKAGEIFQDTEFFIKESKAPSIEIERKQIAPGMVRGLFGTTREFLIVTDQGNFRLKPYQIFINARKKGIWLDIHPKCETLEFTFDLNTLELADYQMYDHSPGVVYGYNGFCCKTQFAGLKTHIVVCKIIKLTEKYIDFSNINDEGDFYQSQDIEKAKKAFGESTAGIQRLGKILKEAGKGLGLRVVTGDEM